MRKPYENNTVYATDVSQLDKAIKDETLVGIDILSDQNLALKLINTYNNTRLMDGTNCIIGMLV